MNPLNSRQSFSDSSTSTALRAEYGYEYDASPASNLNLKTCDFGRPPCVPAPLREKIPALTACHLPTGFSRRDAGTQGKPLQTKPPLRICGPAGKPSPIPHRAPRAPLPPRPGLVSLPAGSHG